MSRQFDTLKSRLSKSLMTNCQSSQYLSDNSKSEIVRLQALWIRGVIDLFGLLLNWVQFISFFSFWFHVITLKHIRLVLGLYTFLETFDNSAMEDNLVGSRVGEGFKVGLLTSSSKTKYYVVFENNLVKTSVISLPYIFGFKQGAKLVSEFNQGRWIL